MESALRVVLTGDIVPPDSLSVCPSVERVVAILQGADITFGNIEAAVSLRGAPVEKLYHIRVTPSALDVLIQMGFTVMSVANNHTLDYGLDAFADTLSLLRQKSILPVGGGQHLGEAWQPVIVSQKDVKIALLAAACTLPPGFAAGEGRPGIAPIRVSERYEVDPSVSYEQPGSSPYVHTWAWPNDVETAQVALRAAKAEADFVVLSIHRGVPPLWNAPFQGRLAAYQRPLAHALVEAGADLIVGHHPHSLLGFEIYRGKPIFYSLGNFLFSDRVGALYPPMAQNLPYTFEIDPNPEWCEAVVVQVSLAPGQPAAYEIWPTRLDEDGQPHLLDGEEAVQVIRRLAAMSARMNGELIVENGRGRLVM